MLKAAFFDVGDTLVEHWAGREITNRIARAQVCGALGEPGWIDEFLDAEIEPVFPGSLLRSAMDHASGTRYASDASRQETLRWYRDWFAARGIDVSGIDLDRVRSLMCVPLKEISTPVSGAFEALRWCASRGLRVVLVTNTLARGDAEALADWRRFGVDDAIHAVVSSHDAGWRKPHPAIFERALERAGARADEVFHVGDNLIADIWGAQQLGIRAVWRRPVRVRPPTDERGEPPARAARRSHEDCPHPAETLTLEDGRARCLRCGALPAIEIRPDATIADLTELPGVVERWLEVAA